MTLWKKLLAPPEEEGGVPVSSLSFVDSALSTTSTITVPAGASAGDLAILIDVAYASGAGSMPTTVVPADFTTLAEHSATVGVEKIKVIISAKILAGGDAGASKTVMNGFTANEKTMLIMAGDVPVNDFSSPAWNNQFTTDNPSSQSVTASGGAAPLIVIGIAWTVSNATDLSFSTASPAFDGTAMTANGDSLVGYKIYNSSPSDHSIDMNDFGTNALLSGYIEVS